MSKMIQIRNVPEPIHRKLKARAAEEGISLSDLALREVTKAAERPTMKEIWERIQKRPPVIRSEPPEDMIRTDRESH